MKPALSLSRARGELNVEPEERPTSGGAWAKIKRFLVGRALRTEQAIHERLTKKVALAVFSSDALSSTAYATEEIMLVLAAAVAFGQTTAFSYVLPISAAIAILLLIVAISYRSEEHTSELQSRFGISHAVFC